MMETFIGCVLMWVAVGLMIGPSSEDAPDSRDYRGSLIYRAILGPLIILLLVAAMVVSIIKSAFQR